MYIGIFPIRHILDTSFFMLIVCSLAQELSDDIMFVNIMTKGGSPGFEGFHKRLSYC